MRAIPIPGCRHDVLGHNLKAIGLLRVLATCAEPEHRDVEAEGWWDLDSACFMLRSEKYSDEDKLVKFFAEHYQPTPIFSPWNTGGGFNEQREVVVTFSKTKTNKKGISKPTKPKQEDTIKLTTFLWKNRRIFRESGLNVRKKISALRAKSPTEGEFSFVLKGTVEPTTAEPINGITVRVQIKASSKKDIIPILEREHRHLPHLVQGINISRRFFVAFQRANSSDDVRWAFESLRDHLPDLATTAMDSILTTRTARIGDNPLFLNRGKGEGGNDELFRTFWNYFLAYMKHSVDYAEQCLFSRGSLGNLTKKDKEGIGTPVFPDAIKTYNHGAGWVVGAYAFNALDYLLAVEGALSMRGATSRSLAANSKRFAAFPFIFDTGEDLTDGKEVADTASSVWLPLWDRPASFAELESFICDAQARLPGKEARFSSEFARALRVQGVDAGFAGWQEFRFKMKASRVPWVCTGRYVGATHSQRSALLSDALAPLDESGFLDQFEVWHDPRDRKIKPSSPHYIRADLNGAIEDAVAEPTPENALGLLVSVYAACRRLTDSKSLREKIADTGQRVVFFDALAPEPWQYLLNELGHLPEFRIARALASIIGFAKQQKQSNGRVVFSEVQPFLGSLLPLKRGWRGWYLPESGDRSKQAVWSASDLSHDLARTLLRRYLDSLKDDRPALMSCHPARLTDILAFLNGELNDNRIARWTEALSLIGWHWDKKDEVTDSTLSAEEQSVEEANRLPAIPPAYAALRSLLEVECEWQGNDASLWKKRRSQRPISLLCQRVPSSLALAVEAALQWLSVWGVRNCWGKEARIEKPRLQGRDVVDIDHRELDFNSNSLIVSRLAAAVLIPLDWRDRWTIFRAVTLPQTVKR